MKTLKSKVTICYLKGMLYPKTPILLGIILLTLFFNYTAFSQTLQSHNLGNEALFSKRIMANTSAEIELELPEKHTMLGEIALKKGTTENYKITGSIDNNPSATFMIAKNEEGINGHLILMDEKKAYKYTSNDNQEVVVKEIDIDKLICVGYPIKATKTIDTRGEKKLTSQKVPILQSYPGVEGTVYLDFDGELVSGSDWLNGKTIDAKPVGYTDEEITNIWRIVSEDFLPFNVNITTDRAIFDAAPINRRIQCIFTNTNDAEPRAGGIAFLFSFTNFTDNPCWVFNEGVRAAGETASHEVGHTMGLVHDGINELGFYSGRGQWSPIMGYSVNTAISQWSNGDYDNATITEDDVESISGGIIELGYRKDDYGNTISEASELKVNSDGSVDSSQNEGLITTRDDKDVFSFVTTGGEVRFDFKPDPYFPNLNIQARILNAQGKEVAIDSPFEDLSASITTTLPGGTYFIEIDGVGEGNSSNGYSDYGSIGFYSISGQILEQTLGIDNAINLNKEIMIFPNPTNEELHIKGLNSLNQVHDIRILNNLGQTLRVYNQAQETLNVKELTDGLYFIMINNKIVRKFQRLSR